MSEKKSGATTETVADIVAAIRGGLNSTVGDPRELVIALYVSAGVDRALIEPKIENVRFTDDARAIEYTLKLNAPVRRWFGTFSTTMTMPAEAPE